MRRSTRLQNATFMRQNGVAEELCPGLIFRVLEQSDPVMISARYLHRLETNRGSRNRLTIAQCASHANEISSRHPPVAFDCRLIPGGGGHDLRTLFCLASPPGD